MIVGNGLIASAFIRAGFHSSDHVIFASGVSNSTETNPDAYKREWNLLNTSIAKNTTFVYFSTTSIFDPTRQDSVYILHKKSIETYIRSTADSYIIVRLPIIAGNSSNPYTLINFLVNAIRSNTRIQLHAKACRHLLDIDDLVPIILPYINEKISRLDLNIPGSEKISLPQLINEIENEMQRRGEYTWLDTGACYDIPEDAGVTLYVKQENYIQNILHKYLGK